MEHNTQILVKDVNYIFSCLDTYLPSYPLSKIPGSVICEIGPGKNLGVCLVFKSLGAACAHGVDKYYVARNDQQMFEDICNWSAEWNEVYHRPFYQMLEEETLKRYPWADPRPFRQAQEGHTIDGIFVRHEDAENITEIAPASVDLCFSMAVLEHLYNPPAAFASFARITKPGGMGIHQVDFRSHKDFDRPLEHLARRYRWNEPLPPDTYDWIAERLYMTGDEARARDIDSSGMIRRACGIFGNGWRSVEYDKLWVDNGFDISFEPNMFAEEKYFSSFMDSDKSGNPHLAEFSETDLKIISGKYVARKS